MERVHRRGDLDAVDVRRSAGPSRVGNLEEVVAVLFRRPDHRRVEEFGEVALSPEDVAVAERGVVGRDFGLPQRPRRVERPQLDHGIDGQPEAARPDPHLQRRALLHREAEAVGLVGLREDAVDRHGRRRHLRFGRTLLLEHVGKRTRTQGKRQWRLTSVWERAGRLRHRHRLRHRAKRVAEQLHGQGFACRPAGRVGGERLKEAADVDGVLPVVRDEHRPLEDDRIVAVDGQLEREKRVLTVERRVVVHRDPLAGGVEDRDDRVVALRHGIPLEVVAHLHHVDLDREPLARLARHAEAVDVVGGAVGEDAGDGDVLLHPQRRVGGVVGVGLRLPFVDHRKGADIDRGHRREPSGREDAEGMLPRAAVRRHLERAHEPILRCVERRTHAADTGRTLAARVGSRPRGERRRRVEQDVGHLVPPPADHEFGLLAPAHEPRRHAVDPGVGRRGGGQHGDENQGHEWGPVGCAHARMLRQEEKRRGTQPISDFMISTSFTISIGRVPNATSSLLGSIPIWW